MHLLTRHNNRSDGYDGKFDTYSHAVADSAGKSVTDFVNKHGTDYFSCMISETSLCCSDCKGANGNGAGDPCAYCFDGDCYKTVTGLRARADDPFYEYSFSDGTSSLLPRDHPHPEQVRIVKSVNESEPCPPDYSKRGFGPDNPYEQSVYWTLLDDKADKFYADLLGDTGIPKDKIKMGNNNRGNDCAPANHMGDGDDCWGTGYDYNFPMPDGYEAKDVANPKDVVQKALDNSDNLVEQLTDALKSLQYGSYYGDELQLVDSVSIPTLMIVNAVEDMSQVEEVADKIDEEKKKALILAFIGALLFFIPIAGEVLGAVTELGDIAAILAVVAAAGDTALGVYQVVDDPSNPLLGIMRYEASARNPESLLTKAKHYSGTSRSLEPWLRGKGVQSPPWYERRRRAQAWRQDSSQDGYNKEGHRNVSQGSVMIRVWVSEFR